MATATEPRMTNPTTMEDPLFEVVGGEVVEASPMGAFEIVLAHRLLRLIDGFAVQHGLGWTFIELLFRIDPQRQTERRPDLAFVSRERLPLDALIPRERSLPVVPDLAVEIVSPSNSANAIAAKVDEYFRAGVRQVWVIYPEIPRLYNFRSPNINQGYDLNDPVDGGDILPGFSFTLADVVGR